MISAEIPSHGTSSTSRRRRRGLDGAFGISLALSLCFHAAGLYFLSHFYFPKPPSHIFMLTESGEEAFELEIGSTFESVESVKRIPEIEERRVTPERRDPEPESKSDVTDLLENKASRLDMPKPAAAERVAVAVDASASVLERNTVEPARETREPEAREFNPPAPLVAALPDPRLPPGEVREQRYAYERPPWAEPPEEQPRTPAEQLPDLLFPVATERLAAETPPDAPTRREAAAAREKIFPELRDLPLPELAEAPDGQNEQGEVEVSEMRYREDPPPLPPVAEQTAAPVPQALPEPLLALASPALPETMSAEPPDKRPFRKTVAAVLPELEPETRDMPASAVPAPASGVPAMPDVAKAVDETRFDAKGGGESGGVETAGLSRLHETREAGSVEMASAVPSERVTSDIAIEPERLNPPRNRRDPTEEQPPLRDPMEERPQPRSAASTLGGQQRKMGVRQQAVRLGTAPKYPKKARERGEEGTVIVRAMIDSSGRCLSAYVLSSSGYRELDRAALSETLKSDFQPASEDGATMAGEADFEFYFEIVSPGWPFPHRKTR